MKWCMITPDEKVKVHMRKCIYILSLSLVCVLMTGGSCRADWVLAPAGIDTEKIRSGGPPKDGIPAIMAPRFLDAGEAGFLNSADKVLGLVVDGRARAYPIRILSWHELVNDTVGEIPVLVSW